MDRVDKRVLHIITHADQSDASRIVELLTTLTDTTAAVACGRENDLIPRLKAEEIDVFAQAALDRSTNPITDIKAFFELYRLLQRESFDLVHCHSTKAGLLGRLAARGTETPVVFTVYEWSFQNTAHSEFVPAMIYGERALAWITDEIVCISETDFEEGRKHGIVKLDTPVLHHGIPPIDLPDDRTTLHELTGIDSGTTIIGAVTPLTSQEDPLTTLQIGRALQERGHDVATVLVGNGPLRERCKQYIERHEFTAYVLDSPEQATELLADIDVYLIPSRVDGCSLTVLECLHLGIPIVASDVGGISEAIDDGETGFVVASDDPMMFADRVEYLVDNHEQRSTMGQHAKEVATSEFTAERMVSNYEHTYLRCLRPRTETQSLTDNLVGKLLDRS